MVTVRRRGKGGRVEREGGGEEGEGERGRRAERRDVEEAAT